mmetsp:Transcript_22236/g.26710  ORF Transcript_22236/g.26710 Transcript_22236/m.26710 type:complete len:508 (+) Transcript_22236:76-1599(+)|eukprot:CAMPEP_0197862090 /NCGR_PEP_ID=MMETSP1438-20131217/38566_1 /TAXON_ID=1461541 /ORGANISM="Pterosperma sp., Strain CCMP1384" /LENGTH=507 /DNA_ID=CAMNT_0043479511 /DNA_START=74 /DNA_END=1597 /DNA_ORIENTATION=+
MSSSKILKHYSLNRNPFTDRTAEKSNLTTESYYIHSDLQGFEPNETTYLFFGKRGSGKTTIRMQMQRAYEQFNATALVSGLEKAHFIVDLCKPGHITSCLRAFQAHLACGEDSWDTHFSENWLSADLVDCILSYAATALVEKFRTVGPEAQAMTDALRLNDKCRKQFLLLAHLYANSDHNTLALIRQKLMPPRSTAASVALGMTAVTSIGGAGYGLHALLERGNPTVDKLAQQVNNMLPAVLKKPKVAAVAGVTAAGVLYAYTSRSKAKRSLARAQALLKPIHVVPHKDAELIEGVVGALFTRADTADAIRSQYLGNSGHQKLDLLQSLVQNLGYQSVAVFGDCFDEVTLLDPVVYPAALKAFAREVCRNDILNFGRLHFFFPDSRIALDLNTDRVLKEARFDRHFVRDLVWSRHQLEDLAERRFKACQASGKGEVVDDLCPEFSELFAKVGAEDFHSSLAKLHTPRELLIMMTEMLSRIESHNENDYTVAPQDMEIAVQKASEQTV